MLRRTALLIVCVAIAAFAQDTNFQPQGTSIPGPGQPNQAGWVQNLKEFNADRTSDSGAWLKDMRQWRQERLIRMGYNDAEYRRPEFQWAQRNFISPQSMVEDRYFYDPEKGQYTVDHFLDDLDKRYGGIDSVLIWPVYPNIGIDNRNQWDLTRDLPGGPAAIRKMIDDFHRRGVHVIFPTMPWDTGTRDPGMPYWDATARLMADIGADAVNGDTFSGVPRAYRTASDATGHSVIFQPENWPDTDETLMWNNMSWGRLRSSFIPPVSRLKWLEPRHMVDTSDRWSRDKTEDMQFAFFNGIGMVTWENIWGIWNQLTPHDAEMIRRVATLQRRFASFFVSPDWEPYSPTMQFGVFASKWPGNKAETVWTIVNRNEYPVSGEQMRIPCAAGTTFYDLWHGVELKPRIENGEAILSFDIEGSGFGAVHALAPGFGIDSFDDTLRTMAKLSATPLSSYSREWHFLAQQIVDIPKTAVPAQPPANMARVPHGEFEFRVSGVEIEGANWEGLDVQYPWEPSPHRNHRHLMQVHSFYIDKHPVTNAEFKRFIDATHYHPRDDHNFLKDWTNGNYPAGWGNRPVTWVSLEDARAYAKWAGKRLPHEWEWQYAAQGTDGRLYPWGSQWDSSAVPVPDKGRDLRGPDNVDAHPQGASPFGVVDMVGNVWQWTDEFTDEHTRAAIVRGGSYYQPQGSMWYFPQAYKLTEHGKYLLMAPSKDRAGTLGFRCVVDAE